MRGGYFMNLIFPKGKYIFLWGGLIANAGGMTRAMLKRACLLIQAGVDVTILISARGIEQFNIVEHYQKNGFPEINRNNFVIREAWMGEILSNNNKSHDIGILSQLNSLCVKSTSSEKIYWKDGLEFAREILNKPQGIREIRYMTQEKELISEIYWENTLSRIVTDFTDQKGIKHRKERYFSQNGFCHTVFENIWKDNKWEIVDIKSFDEKNQKIIDLGNYSNLREMFFSSYVNKCNNSQIFVFCDPILDFEPGFSKMHEIPGKSIYKIAINHGIGFGGERTWNSIINPRIKNNIENTVIPNIDAFILLTKRAENDFRKRLGGRNIFYTIPNTIRIPEEIRPFSERDLNRIVYIGRFDENQKQISHLIKAFSIVSKKYPNSHLHIFGRGNSEGLYRKLIEDLHLTNVFIEPFTNNVDAEFQKCAFPVVCSEWESFCLSLYESLANGCPVVSYDFRYGAREGIVDRKNGLLVEPNNIDLLADKICWMLSHKEKIEEMSVNARVMIGKYNEKFYAENWNKVINDVAHAHRFRTQLTDIDFTLLKKNYSQILKRMNFEGLLTVSGSVPKIAIGMQKIYLRVYNSDESDYEKINCKNSEILNDSMKYDVSGKFFVQPGCKVTICLEWNNCFIEKNIEIWD